MFDAAKLKGVYVKRVYAMYMLLLTAFSRLLKGYKSVNIKNSIIIQSQGRLSLPHMVSDAAADNEE